MDGLLQPTHLFFILLIVSKGKMCHGLIKFIAVANISGNHSCIAGFCMCKC